MDKMVTRLIAEGTKDERSQLPMALSLLNSHKLSNDDIDYMIMEFLMGGVDTVCRQASFNWIRVAGLIFLVIERK